MVQFSSDAVMPTRAARLIVLDRDGVINHDSEQFIKSPEEWRAIPGHIGPPWFLPAVGLYYRLKDRLA